MAKILFCVNSLSLGGVERRLSQLILGLGRLRIHTLYCILNSNTRFIDPDVKKYAIFFIVDSNTNKELVIKRYSDIISDISPDIIHCWTMRQCNIINSINQELLQNRVYICGAVNSSYVYPQGSNHKKILDTCIEKADIIVSNSNAGIKAKQIPVEKSIVIKNGYDFNSDCVLNKTSNISLLSKIKHYDVCVFMACRICPEKDIDMFINLAKKYEHDNRFIFVLAGDGSSCTDSFFKEIHQQNNIMYIGFQQDIGTYINAADICVLLSNPPHKEGISNFIMESMAHGKIVIATCGGGTNEIIKHEENGILINPHDLDRICHYLTEFANNRQLFKNIGLNAKKTIMTEFNLNDKVKEYLLLYEKMIEKTKE